MFRAGVRAAALLGHRRAQALLRFRSSTPIPNGPFDLWIHCASHGEWETVQPVVLRYRTEHPSDRILITFFSPSGLHASIPTSLNASIATLPWDTPRAVRDFLDRTQPKRLVLVQYDLWPALLHACRTRRIPWGVVNARWTPSLRWTRNLWQSASWITVQTSEDAAHFRRLGLNAQAVGDTRFDNVVERASQPLPFNWLPPAFAAFNDAQGLVVLGSVWPEDAPLVLPLIARFPEYKWLVVPHDVGEESLRFWASKIPVPHLRWSQLEGVNVEDSGRILHPENARALVVDRVGLLFSLYSLASFAYVGGGRSDGQHNYWEPLAWGVPTAIAHEGLEARTDAREAVDAGFLHPAHDAENLREQWVRWQNNPPQGCTAWMQQKGGASEATLRAILPT
jgi:3-deoxy-D-manno-octulosonic-acid transferase